MHTSTNHNIVKFLIVSQVFLFVLVFYVPAFSIRDYAGHISVEFAHWVNATLLSETLDVLLHFLPTREFVDKVLFFLVVEAWEFVQLTWHLKSRLCSMTAPNTANIGLRFEESAVNAQAPESVHGLEASDTSTNDANLVDVFDSRRKGASLEL